MSKEKITPLYERLGRGYLKVGRNKSLLTVGSRELPSDDTMVHTEVITITVYYTKNDKSVELLFLNDNMLLQS